MDTFTVGSTFNMLADVGNYLAGIAAFALAILALKKKTMNINVGTAAFLYSSIGGAHLQKL